MSARKQLTANLTECHQPGAGKICEVDGAFVVVELADEELARTDVRPAKKWIRLQLHGALADDDALTVVRRGMRIGEIG